MHARLDLVLRTEQAAAQRLLDEGIALADVGRLTEAVALLRQALAELHLDEHGSPRVGAVDGVARAHAGSGLSARILLSSAFPHHELGHQQDAVQALRDAERIARKGRHPDITALAHAQRGAMLIREGRLREALASLDRAVDLLEHAPNIDQCKIMLNRGELHARLGHVGPARADCARGLELALGYGLADFAFYASHNLGWSEFLAGNLARALELMPLAEQAHTDLDRGIVGMDRSRVLLSAGLVTEADRTLLEACEALGRTELVQILAEAELTRAEVALLAGRPELAQALARTAVARLRPRNNLRATALGELVALRADAEAGVRADQVVRTAERLADGAECAGYGGPVQAGATDRPRPRRAGRSRRAQSRTEPFPPTSRWTCSSTAGWSEPSWRTPATTGRRRAGKRRPA